MPGVVVGFTSGGQRLFSGAPYSGSDSPVGGIRLVAWGSNSGSVYVGLSGGMTVLSGGFPLSGGGGLDGTPMAPGDNYFVPKVGLQSGGGNIYLAPDAACSGQARIFYELM